MRVVLTDGVTIAVPPAEAAVYRPTVDADAASVVLGFVTVTFRKMNLPVGSGMKVSPTVLRSIRRAMPSGPRELPLMDMIEPLVVAGWPVNASRRDSQSFAHAGPVLIDR